MGMHAGPGPVARRAAHLSHVGLRRRRGGGRLADARRGEQVLEAAARATSVACYVPGAEIVGDSLRTLSKEPIISGPLVCQLCDDRTFAYDADFAAHKENVHAGENEYRKRVLFLMEHC